MRRVSDRLQQTIRHPVEVEGIGFLTGAEVRLRFLPAPPDTGIVFVRTDLDPPQSIPARVERVTGTARRTTLGHLPAQVSLVEHVVAALAGLHIDNCRVELNAPEPPGLDGSSLAFVRALVRADAEVQDAPRGVWRVDHPIILRQGGATIAFHPPRRPGLTVTYFLDYGHDVSLRPHCRTQPVTPQTFLNDIAGCRTFLLEREAYELRKQGLGSRTTAADLLVFGSHGPIDNTLRFEDEPARHKILDIVGDLGLLGADLHGHVVAYRSGHPLNIELARTLRARMLAPTLCGLARAA
jgi:UDP-3-O-acyl N-acetylglucosamine deacetylase